MSPALYLIDTSGLFRDLAGQAAPRGVDGSADGRSHRDLSAAWSWSFCTRLVRVADRTEKRRMLRGGVRLGSHERWRLGACGRGPAGAHRDEDKHRSAGPVDLLIAATAEHQRLILLTDDKDFEVVASVTGQPVRRVADAPSSSAGRAAAARAQGRRRGRLVADRAQARHLVDVLLGGGLGVGVRGGVLARQPGREVPARVLVVGRDRGGGELGGEGGRGRLLEGRAVDGRALGRGAALGRPGPLRARALARAARSRSRACAAASASR